MNSTLIAFVSIGLYGLGTLFEALSHLKKARPTSSTPLLTGLIALLAHAWFIVAVTGGLVTDNYTLVNSAAIVSCIVVAILIGISFKRPTQSMLLVIYPAAILSIITLSLQQPSDTERFLSTPILAHVGLSILAYSVLTLASLQAVLVVLQNHNLKHHKSTKIIEQLPPLLTMERILFDLLRAGTAILAAAIVIGIAFIEDMFAQHLAHKTFFSLLALGIFATLLFGRSRYGWRGALAGKLTLWGISFLMIGFFGSKFVLENVL
jgi:ABC-type uncharacterized transport system permease subunit